MPKWIKKKSIGKGAFGVVFHATHPQTGHAVAMKELAPTNNIIKRARNQKHFITEIEILKKVQHPHIVKLIDYQFKEHNWFIVLELAEPGDLYYYLVNIAKCIDKKTLCDVQIQDHLNKSKQWAAQLLDAVHYLHQAHVFHRDIKLENLMLKGNQIVLSDFGFATTHDRHTTCVGSPPYLAPELTKQLTLPYSCEKADLYSLGVTLSLMVVDIRLIDYFFLMFDQMVNTHALKPFSEIRKMIQTTYETHFKPAEFPLAHSLMNLCDPQPNKRNIHLCLSQLPLTQSLFMTNDSKSEEELNIDNNVNIELQPQEQQSQCCCRIS